MTTNEGMTLVFTEKLRARLGVGPAATAEEVLRAVHAALPDQGKPRRRATHPTAPAPPASAAAPKSTPEDALYAALYPAQPRTRAEARQAANATLTPEDRAAYLAVFAEDV